MKTQKLKFITLYAVIGLFLPINASYAYVVGGANASIVPDSGSWSWDGSYLTDFRDALENPDYFGATGIVNQSISTTGLNSVNATSLSTVDMFVSSWISDADGAAFGAGVVDFFLNGGDLFLLQDDANHDYIGSLLGISTTASTGSVSNGGVPLFDGPFGIANDVDQFYLTGQLDSTAIATQGGHIGGTNVDGQVTSAFWSAGEYAAGAGSLFIIADIDMIATTTSCGLALCGASYDPLNDNGIYALNTFSFLQANGGSASVPEPSIAILMASGLIAFGVVRRKSRV